MSVNPGKQAQRVLVISLSTPGDIVLSLGAAIVGIDDFCWGREIEVYFQFGESDWLAPINGHIENNFRHRMEISKSTDDRSLLSMTSRHDWVRIAFRDGCNDLQMRIYNITGEPFE